MVFYILAREVLIMIPVGGEYPNVKCKNRSPYVDYYNDDNVCFVRYVGDVHSSTNVDLDSHGRYILHQKKWIFHSPDIINYPGAAYVYNVFPGGNISSSVNNGGYVSWNSGGLRSPGPVATTMCVMLREMAASTIAATLRFEIPAGGKSALRRPIATTTMVRAMWAMVATSTANIGVSHIPAGSKSLQSLKVSSLHII